MIRCGVKAGLSGCIYGCPRGYHEDTCPLSRRGTDPERCNQCSAFSFTERQRLPDCRADSRCPRATRSEAA